MERERQSDREIAIKKYPERQTDRQTERAWWGVGATEERFERAARRVRQSARNPAGMRFSSSCCLLLLGLVLQAAAFVDEDNDAIVIEGMTTQQLASPPPFLKIHKNEKFLGSDFEFYTTSLLVMLKY
jgi:hypothetical protein